MSMADSDVLVCLPAGPSGTGLTLPLAPLQLLWDLENRGFAIGRDGDVLVIRPPHLLTGDDCSAIRRWKPHLLALIEYQPPEAA
jgi:hypothetical protein